MDFQRISVSLIGNATKDAVVKAAKESGTVYGDFTLAVKDRQKETHFFPVRCFGKLAESVANIKKAPKCLWRASWNLAHLPARMARSR